MLRFMSFVSLGLTFSEWIDEWMDVQSLGTLLDRSMGGWKDKLMDYCKDELRNKLMNE